jgi:D-3-phosphoglycerate dehydrogenase
VIIHRNIPNTLGQFTATVAKENINISDMVNRSKGEYAVTMLDLDTPAPAHAIEALQQIDAVIRVRVIK